MDSEELNNRSSQHHHHHHHHHRRRWLKWVWILVGLVVVVALFFAGMAWRNVRVATNNMYSPSGVVKSRNLNKLLDAKKPINVLLLGTDTGALGRSYKGRTDTIMMMSINPKTQKTTIVSIPRDMEVTLPDYSSESPSKLNAAYTYGGVKETIKTIKEYYNVPIDGYVLVNMGGLEKAINQIGGVTVTSPLTFSYCGYTFEKGKTYTMKGAQALAFSRMRHEDPNGDYGRQERQRLVIAALLKKAASYKAILNQSFLNSIADETQTDFTFNNMMNIALHYRGAGKTVTSDHAQGESQMISGESFEVVSATERQRVSNEIRANLGLKQLTVKTESN
ncbi:LCP family protein [Limosilactobacillus gorillae]|uniref:LCP family protein n=1 Tax=Limosilactobacillus gorillae TaxID=1450649 RepID=UPI000B03C703|nr:LCP family protein [Limosilactobacillus gorillae]